MTNVMQTSCLPLRGQFDRTLPLRNFASKVSFGAEGSSNELLDDEFANSLEAEPKAPLAKSESFDIVRAAKKFGKGLISPITSIFESAKSVAVTAGVGAVGYFLLKHTNNKIGPVLVTAGLALGVIQAALGIRKVVKAEGHVQKENAFEDIGTGAGTMLPFSYIRKTIS